jgi:penicillin-binding protein 1A
MAGFLGFSSGLTTGVWMGRDDAKRVGGLQGGTAPARAFANFMRVAVANRPVEEFDTQVTLPEWQLEPDQEAWGEADNGVFVDQDGNPVARDEEPIEGEPAPGDEGAISQDWLDRMTGRDAPRDPQPVPRRDPADRPPQQQAPQREPLRAPQDDRPNE